MDNQSHVPVLVQEVLELVPERARLVVDCTIGGGGHAEAILTRLGNEAELIGFDRDVEAIEIARERLKLLPNKIRLIHDSYANIDQHLGDKMTASVDFVLYDLGLSSLQLDRTHRGFSFHNDSDVLDLRFDYGAGEPLYRKLESASEAELVSVFKQFGEISNSKQLAREIKNATEKRPLKFVADLLAIVSPFAREPKRNQYLAQVWQALRIWVNGELTELQTGLENIVKYLKSEGVVVAISFHSLEDRIVKRFFTTQENPCICPRNIPKCVCGRKPTLKRVFTKAIKPSEVEIANNARARSARLRAAKKLPIT